MAAPKKPKGSKSDKEWRDAIRKAVHELRDDPENGKKTKAIGQLARKLVERAAGGDIAALREIGDRLDGKPAQAVTGEDGGPVKIIVSTGIIRDND